jgi:hypothetical protein
VRSNQEDTNAFNTLLKSGRFSHDRKVLTGDVVVTKNGPLVNFLDPNGADRNVVLPALEGGRFYVVGNVGTAQRLIVQSANSLTITTLLPGDVALLCASDAEWVALRGWAALGVFTNTVNGLVPAPVSVTPGSLFLRDDGQWGQVQVTGIVDAFKFITDGTTIATGSGPDTFRLRSSTGKIGITVQNNDATFGDNANFTVNEGSVNHNALLNYVADQHVAHSGVVINPGTGMSGGGDITASRTLTFTPHSLTVNAAPALTDYAVMDLAAGGPRTTLFSSLNALFIHNNLAGYVANEHINHTGVSIVPGSGISGGGDITTSRTVSLDINGLTAANPATTDSFPYFNAAAPGNRKVSLAVLTGLIDHNSLLNYVANQHIDHTTVSISAGTGLTGGGTIAATRSLSLANIANNTVLGNVSGSAAAPIALTQTQLTALINAATTTLSGAVPAPGTATGKVLSDNLTWVAAGAGNMIGSNNLSDVTNITTARTNIGAADMEAMAFSNMALNPGQIISQEFLATAVTGITATSKYVTDQYVIEAAGAVVVTGQQVTDAPVGLDYSLKITLTTAMAAPGLTDLLVTRQPIEGYQVTKLKLGTANAIQFSVGEWVKSNVAGTFYAFALSSGADRVYLNKVTLVAGTWTWVPYSASAITSGTFGTGANKAIDIGWCLAAGTSRKSGTASGLLSGNFRAGTDQTNWAASLTGGTGSTAPTFQRSGLIVLSGTQLPSSTDSVLMIRPFDVDLWRCQRWWEKSTDYNTICASNIAGAGLGLCQAVASTSAFANSANWFYKARKATNSPTLTTFNPYAAGSGFSESGAGNLTVGINCSNESVAGFRCDQACSGVGNTLYLNATSNCRMA